MVKASGDSLGLLLILKMEIMNVFFIGGKLLANLLKDAVVCTFKQNIRNPAMAACKCLPLKKASYHIPSVKELCCLPIASG